MALSRICVLGVGLMGGSIALACRRDISDLFINGYSNNPDELRRAIQRAAIHSGTGNPLEAIAAADLVILCTPVGLFGKMLAAIARGLKPGTVVTDVGSTKRSIVKLAEDLLPSTVHFVGSHPLVGGEKHGIDNARADLLAGGLCLITPTESTDPNAIETVENFWIRLKMRTTRLSPEAHDRVTADISHLPHLIAAALVRIQQRESLTFAGRGFADTTRVAAGNPELWRDILLDNRDNLKNGIGRFQNELQTLMAYLDAGDGPAVLEWLKTAVNMKTIQNSSALTASSIDEEMKR